jgi:molybdenum cofactor cytidylyltransferase
MDSDVEGVVLAAGLASRSGGFKMTLPLGDKTVIERSIEGMYGIVSRILVVVGWQAERIHQVLAAYDKVEIVLNQQFRAGMFSSVKAGLARVRASSFFLLPGDCPLTGADIYARMLAVPGDIVVPTFEGKRGHPTLFRSTLIPEILSQPDDSTLRHYVDRKGYAAVEVKDDGILYDMDTPKDYAAVCARLHLQACPSGGHSPQAEEETHG